MNKHYCRVGKIKPNLSKLMSLKELERRITNFVDDATKVVRSEDLNGAS